MSTKKFLSLSIPFSFFARSSADEWNNVIAYDRNQPGCRLLPPIT